MADNFKPCFNAMIQSSICSGENKTKVKFLNDKKEVTSESATCFQSQDLNFEIVQNIETSKIDFVIQVSESGDLIVENLNADAIKIQSKKETSKSKMAALENATNQTRLLDDPNNNSQKPLGATQQTSKVTYQDFVAKMLKRNDMKMQHFTQHPGLTKQINLQSSKLSGGESSSTGGSKKINHKIEQYIKKLKDKQKCISCPLPDISKYRKITHQKQKEEYKADFESHYEEYFKLYQDVCKFNSHTGECEEALREYRSLHEKMKLIKYLVNEYEDQQNNNIMELSF